MRHPEGQVVGTSAGFVGLDSRQRKALAFDISVAYNG